MRIMRSNACHCNWALTSPCALLMTQYGAAGPPGYGAEGPSTVHGARLGYAAPQRYKPDDPVPRMQPAVGTSPACRLYSLRPGSRFSIESVFSPSPGAPALPAVWPTRSTFSIAPGLVTHSLMVDVERMCSLLYQTQAREHTLCVCVCVLCVCVSRTWRSYGTNYRSGARSRRAFRKQSTCPACARPNVAHWCAPPCVVPMSCTFLLERFPSIQGKETEEKTYYYGFSALTCTTLPASRRCWV